MARIDVPYETAEESGVTLSLDIPDGNLAAQYVPLEPKGIEDLEAALLNAVESPWYGKKFSDLVKEGSTVAFLTENQFRAAPTNKLLLPLIKKARDAGADVRVAIGCGKVPPLSPEEIKEKLGPEIDAMDIPVVCNDVGQADKYAFLGNTSAGTPVWVLKSVLEADVIISISTTQATLWGYGGSGMIIPAVSGNETIETNHIMSLAPDCLPGNNDCAMQLDKYEALEMVGVDMGVNVIVANNWDVVYVNAGHPVASHQAAVDYYDDIYRFNVEDQGEYDIVIAGSSAPTDHLFFHTGWAVVNCRPLAKENGTIIFCSPCPGYHDWPGFALMDLMKEYMPPSPENHEKLMRAFFQRDRELWAGCIWYPIYRTLLNRDVQIVTREENLATARDIGLNADSSLEGVFEEAMKKHGPKARVAYVPFGRYSVFSV